MLKFVAKRIFYGFFVLIGVTVSVFFIFHALPGDPVSMIAGQRTDVSTKEAIMKDLGLDKPLFSQLSYYLNDLSFVSIHEDTPQNSQKYDYIKILTLHHNVLVCKSPYLRRSFQSNKKVTDILWEHMEGTFWLAVASMLFASVFGVVMGVFAALRQNTWVDHTLITISVIGISAPSFVAAILVAMVFGYYLGEYTGLNITGQLWVTDSIYGRHLELKNLILPTLTLGLRPLAIIVQLTRSSMIEVLSQDYIRTARAKGLKSVDIIWKHALKNAINPVITAVSGWLASLMAGAFFIEYIFNWKGIGLVTIKAVENLDFPVVMGSTLIIAVVFIFVNLLVDVLYALVDPRVRLA
ncbi:MAG: ABC transporter permease [Cytophagales bacterium]|nr:ABC transporter permease [Cytophagales bacterium]